MCRIATMDFSLLVCYRSNAQKQDRPIGRASNGKGEYSHFQGDLSSMESAEGDAFSCSFMTVYEACRKGINSYPPSM